jgi:hypothetical protein
MESKASTNCFLSWGEAVGARAMSLLADTLDVERGRLGAMI